MIIDLKIHIQVRSTEGIALYSIPSEIDTKSERGNQCIGSICKCDATQGENPSSTKVYSAQGVKTGLDT